MIGAVGPNNGHEGDANIRQEGKCDPRCEGDGDGDINVE